MPKPPPCPSTCNILLIGGGGREHALAWKMRQSPRCGTIWLTDPGNAGLARLGRPCPHIWEAGNTYPLVTWCEKQGIDLIVVGPEQALSDGIADALGTDDRHVFGPSKAGANLEADKAFAKELMRQAAVPTAEGRVFESANAARRFVMRGLDRDLDGSDDTEPLRWFMESTDDRGAAAMPELTEAMRTALAGHREPVVVKACGLAAGKGVVVCHNTLEALDAIESIMIDRAHGEAGARILIEEMLEGQEVSVLALVDGRTIWILDPCQDHKQVGEGDVGANTGGMGAYCPTPIVDADMLEQIEKTILLPIVDALRRRDIDYRGVLYAGLMLTPGGPKVLEFNCRFGDPECQPLMTRLKGDLVDILWRTSTGTLYDAEIDFDARTACCVVMCSEGYPGAYEKGREIDGLDEVVAEDLVVFHAGTTIDHAGRLTTSGGRVLGLVALADDLASARQRVNAACDAVRFDGCFFRRDIGHRIEHLTPTATQ